MLDDDEKTLILLQATVDSMKDGFKDTNDRIRALEIKVWGSIGTLIGTVTFGVILYIIDCLKNG